MCVNIVVINYCNISYKNRRKINAKIVQSMYSHCLSLYYSISFYLHGNINIHAMSLFKEKTISFLGLIRFQILIRSIFAIIQKL